MRYGLDSQNIKPSTNVPLRGQGTDAGTRIIGRKRHLGCYTLRLRLTVLVTSAAINHGARQGIDVHPVQRPPGSRGFAVIPWRRTIERNIGWLVHYHRRLTGEATPNWRGTPRDQTRITGPDTRLDGPG